MYRMPKCNCLSRTFCSDSYEPNKNEEKVKINEKEVSELPEAPTTCCMSGCANCVWLEYAEKVTQYFKDGGEKAINEINEKVDDPNIKAFILHELRMRNIT